MNVQICRKNGVLVYAIRIASVADLAIYVQTLVTQGKVEIGGYCVCDQDGRRWSIGGTRGMITLLESDTIPKDIAAKSLSEYQGDREYTAIEVDGTERLPRHERQRSNQNRKHIQLSITCAECEGTVRLPSDFDGTLKCPNCASPVYINDSSTGITWTSKGEEATTVEMVSVPYTSAHEKTDPNRRRLNKGFQEVTTATKVCLVLGFLGLWGNGMVAVANQEREEGYLIMVLFNPLVWAGCYGFFKLFGKTQSER